MRIASIYSFLDRAIQRLNTHSNESLSLIIKYLTSESSQTFLLSIENSMKNVDDNIFISGGVSTICIKIPKTILQLCITRCERIKVMMSSNLQISLSQYDSLFLYCQANGIECERHQQQLRELLKYLLVTGHWELGECLAKCYMSDYQGALDSNSRKKDIKYSTLAIQTSKYLIMYLN